MGIFSDLANAKAAKPKTQTFDSPEAALAHARKLLARGEISKAEYAALEKKLNAQSEHHQTADSGLMHNDA